MKKLYTLLLLIAFSFQGFSQKIQTLEPSVKAKFPFKINFEFNNFSSDLSRIYGVSDKEIALMDLNTGQLIWHIKAKDLGVKEDLVLQKKTIGYCLITTKEKTPRSFLIDTRSGKVIENENASWYHQLSPEEQKAATAEYNKRHTSRAFNSSDNFLRLDNDLRGETEGKWNDLSIKFNYPKESRTSAFGSKKDLSVVAKKQDNSIAWKVDFRGEVVRPLCHDFNNSGSFFGDNLVSMEIIGDKALVLFEGLACIDLNKGMLLWQMDLNRAELSIGLKAKQLLGLTAKPLVIGQSIIVADLTKGNKTIKKIDLNTGNVIWTSEKLSSGDGVPVIHVNNNQLICQVGGIIERQEYLAGMGANSSSVCKAFAYLTDDNDLLVLDIETGKTIWNAEKHFKQYKDKFKHLALSKLVNNELVVVTDKNALLLDANSGVLKKSLSIEDMNIGELKYAFNMPGQDIFLYGEEGVARITTQVEKKYAVNTKKNLDVKIEREGIIRVCTDKSGSGTFNKFVLINSVTGEVYGQAEDMPYPYFDADMTSFIDFDGRSTIRKFVFRNK